MQSLPPESALLSAAAAADQKPALNKANGKNVRRRAPLGDISNRGFLGGSGKGDAKEPGAKRSHVIVAEQRESLVQVDHMLVDEACDEVLVDDDVQQPVGEKAGANYLNISSECIEVDMDNDDEEDADPQLVKEYVDDIYCHYFNVESKELAPCDYMDRQVDIRPDMRRVLIDWLVEVHTMFNLKPETLFLGINLLDRFLSKRTVKRTSLQLVGSAALFVASKYEEMFAPEVEDFVYVSDKAFNRDDVLYYESLLCTQLKFLFSVPTPFHFSQRFAAVAELNERNCHFMNYLLELALLEYSFLKYPPSVIAASAVYLTTYFDATAWTDELKENTRYTYATIRPCVKEMYALLANGRSSSVRKKYSHKSRCRVTQIGQEVVDAQIRQQQQQQAALEARQ